MEPFQPQKQAQLQTCHQPRKRLSTLGHHIILIIPTEKLKITLPFFKAHQALSFVTIENALEINVSRLQKLK